MLKLSGLLLQICIKGPPKWGRTGIISFFKINFKKITIAFFALFALFALLALLALFARFACPDNHQTPSRHPLGI